MEIELVAARKGMWRIHDGIRNEAAVMSHFKMLPVESIATNQIPRNVIPNIKRTRRQEFVWRHPFKEWHRKAGFRTVEKENMPTADFDGKSWLPCEWRDLR
ncbi:MAG: hypothetical protein ABI318_19475 [Chthoniobacteraceae bacterium]